jgi:hypothetical protein
VVSPDPGESCICSVCENLRAALADLNTSIGATRVFGPGSEALVQTSAIRAFNALLCAGDPGERAREAIVGAFLSTDDTNQFSNNPVARDGLHKAKLAVEHALRQRCGMDSAVGVRPACSLR